MTARAVTRGSRSHPRLDPELMAGLGDNMNANVYCAQNGKWHGHLSIRERRLLADLPRELGNTTDGNSEFGEGVWASVDFLDTEAEATARLCAVIGWVMGRRLAKRFEPRTVPEQTVRDWSLS